MLERAPPSIWEKIQEMPRLLRASLFKWRPRRIGVELTCVQIPNIPSEILGLSPTLRVSLHCELRLDFNANNMAIMSVAESLQEAIDK